MLRQRCMINALIAEAKPLNLLRHYQDLADAGKEILRTDIPQELLPAFADLARKVKEHQIRSVAFVSSGKFFSGDPDFEWMRQVVDRALDPPATAAVRTPGGASAKPDDPTTPDDAAETTDVDPGASVTVADTCAYAPVGSS
jgi:hypothetical protein